MATEKYNPSDYDDPEINKHTAFIEYGRLQNQLVNIQNSMAERVLPGIVNLNLESVED